MSKFLFGVILCLDVLLHPLQSQSFHNCGTYDGAKYPDSISCYNYYECHNGVSLKKTCSFGMVYNCFFKFCTFKAFAPCCRYDPNPPPTENGCLNLGIKIPNPFVCNKYFECRNWRIVEVTCPPGKLFDFLSMSCVDSHGCHCAPGTVIDNSTETTTVQISTEMTTKLSPETPPHLMTTEGTMPASTPPSTIAVTTTPQTTETTTQEITTEPSSTTSLLTTLTSTETTTEFIPSTIITSPTTTMSSSEIPTTESTIQTEIPTTVQPTNSPTETTTMSSEITTSSTTGQPIHCPINGIKLPDTTRCNRYYECQNGTTILKTCRYGFFYNCFLQKCAIFTFTPCCKDDPYPVRNNEYCVSLGKKVPDPFDCTKYFECKKFTIQAFSCPSGKLFDWVLNECVDGNTCECIPNAQNELQSTTSLPETTLAPRSTTAENPWVEWFNFTYEPSTISTTSVESTTDQIVCYECSFFTTSPSLNTESTSTSLSSDLCPYNGIRFPDTRTCRNYYECINGKPVRKSCPLGLVYNCFLRLCTLRAFAPCCRYDPTLPPDDDTCLGLDLKAPNPLECNKYFQCTNFKITEQVCPAGKKYDWLAMNCVDARGCHCAPGL